MSMKLTNIYKEIISEGPLDAVRGMLGSKFQQAERSLLAGAGRLFGNRVTNVASLSKLTDSELNQALKTAEFKAYRASITAGLIAQHESEINKIIKSFDVTTKQGRMGAKAAIANKLQVKNAFADEIFKSKVPKPQGGGGNSGGGNLNRPPLPTGGQQMPPLPPNFPNQGGVNLGNMYNMVQYVNGRSVSQIASRLKNKFPKAPDSKINEIAQNLKNANAYSEMEYNQMFDEAIAGFTPEYEKILLKPTAKTILGKIWQSSSRFVKVLIVLTLIGGANEFFNLFGYNVGDFSEWFTSTWKNFAAQFGKGVVKGGKKPVDGTTPTETKPNNKPSDVDMSKY